MSMDDRNVPKIRTGSDFGTWSGFLVRDLSVRSVVRIFGQDFFMSLRIEFSKEIGFCLKKIQPFVLP